MARHWNIEFYSQVSQPFCHPLFATVNLSLLKKKCHGTLTHSYVNFRKLCDAQKVTKKKKTISTKNVYNLLLKKIFKPPTTETKILKHGFSPKNVQNMYELPSFQIKRDIKIAVFQYKIIHVAFNFWSQLIL